MAGKNCSLLPWLQDTHFSGKWVSLASGTPFTAESIGNHTLRTFFRLAGGLEALLQDNEAVQIAATQDLTNSEAIRVPIRLVLALAPQPKLRVENESDERFLFPTFVDDMRTQYAICGVLSTLDDVRESVSDFRFIVVHEDLEEPGRCGIQIRRDYRSIGEENFGCGHWCKHYLHRAGSYDVSVAQSADECLGLALEFRNVSALQKSLFALEGSARRRSTCSMRHMRSDPLIPSEVPRRKASVWIRDG